MKGEVHATIRTAPGLLVAESCHGCFVALSRHHDRHGTADEDLPAALFEASRN